MQLSDQESDALERWRDEGNRLIPEHFDEFSGLVAQAREFASRDDHNAAAVYGEIAALYAISWHCGIFASPELERTLIEVGRRAIEPTGALHSRLNAMPRNILHVASCVRSIGGHSRMLWRWVQHDAERCHSLALTHQRKDVPEVLSDAIKRSGGRLHRIDRAVGGPVSWARRLRRIAAEADLVVLHIFPDDAIPVMAFANPDETPPILFLNHSDHHFWLGASIADVVVNLRESGMRLSERRRGVPTARNVLLPTVITPSTRTVSRAEAKHRLNLPAEGVLLLSIARAVKFRTVGGACFGDVHVPLLERHKNAVLVVIGPRDLAAWTTAIERAQGRLIVLGERPDTDLFYQAADIYVDSFPFVSTTSLLEAGSYGVPLVSRFPYSDAAEILGADLPGLTGNLIRVRDAREYMEVLSSLIEDGCRRAEIGEATRRRILDVHTGESWLRSLEEVYRCAVAVPRTDGRLAAADQSMMDGPDAFISRIYGAALEDAPVRRNLDKLIETRIRTLPVRERVRQWRRLARENGFHNSNRVTAIRYLVPEWLMGRIRP